MVDLLVLMAFLPAALALNLTPGADMMFCLGQGLRSGPRSAITASAGISAGSMVHVTAAGLGLSTLIASAPWTFDVIRWIGVADLFWLALQPLRQDKEENKRAIGLGPLQAFRSGLIVNLLNPKVMLFVLAFVPQFVDPDRHVLSQFLIFGAIIAFGGFFINAAVGVVASGAGRKLAQGHRALDWVTAGIFATLAARLAIMEKA